MSQPSIAFDSTRADLSPSSDGQQDSQALLEHLFGPSTPDLPAVSSDCSEVLHELDAGYYYAGNAQTDSLNSSTISTTDLANYSFEYQSPAYPTPGPNSPHPYPLDLQQNYQNAPYHQAISHRPALGRFNTGSAFTDASQTSQQYGRRRSLSHSDIDRIAAANTISNPTFIRLQVPRTRSATPEDKRKNKSNPQHGRSASHGSGPRGRPMKPTSTPYVLNGTPMVGGMLPTPIGTPLNEYLEDRHLRCSAYSQHEQAGSGLPMGYAFPRGPLVQRMTRPSDLARSRQIIEIGAMAVASTSRLDPDLELDTPIENRARILKKLDDIERYLQYAGQDSTGALRACAMIREALEKDMDDEVTGGVAARDELVDDHLDAPSKVLAHGDCDMYDGNDGNDLISILMQDADHDGVGIKE